MIKKAMHLLLVVTCVAMACSSIIGQQSIASNASVPKMPEKGSRLDDFRLGNANSFSFHARISQALFDQATNRPVLVPGPLLFVTAARPGSLRIEDKTSQRDVKPGLPIIVGHSDLVITNGKTLLIADSRTKRNFTQPGVPNLEDIRDQNVVLIHPELIFARNFAKDYTFKLDSSYVEGDAQVDDYMRDFTYKGKLIRTHVVLDDATRLPVRVSRFGQDAKGDLVETQRTTYSNWTLNQEYPDSLFDPVPPPDTRPVQEQPSEPRYDPVWRVGKVPASIKTFNLKGKPVSLEAFRGKVVLMDYWATWCGPCQSELPQIVELYRKLHLKGLEIVSVSLDEPTARAQLENTIQQKGLTWQHLYDGKGFQSPLVTAYKISAIPFNIVIGRDGKICAIDVHGKELETAVEKAVSP